MLKYPDIDPVAIEIFSWPIHWYGLMYLIGFAAAWYLAMRQTRTMGVLQRDQVDDLIFYGALGAVLGGRLGYVFFYNFDKFLADPIWLIKVWEGGMAFHGGLLGVIIAIAWYARKIGQPVIRVFDFVAPIAPIGLGAGRIGNFIGQELWGRPSDVPWAMVFPNDPDALARHPSQLYQAALEGVLMFVILFWFSSSRRPPPSIGGLFLLLYGSFRFFVEFFREPDNHIGFDALGWLTRGQILSTPMILIGIAMMVYAYRYNADMAEPEATGHTTKASSRKKKK